jgi:hypothetical protein
MTPTARPAAPSRSTPPAPTSPYPSGTVVTVLGDTGSPPLVNTGYAFTGWDTVADGSATNGRGIFYAPGDSFTIDATTILWAVWIPNSDTVTYNGNGATGGTVPVDPSSPYPHRRRRHRAWQTPACR